MPIYESLPVSALVTLATSLVAGTLGAAWLQRRFPRVLIALVFGAPVSSGAAIAIALALPPASPVRNALEQAVPLGIGYGLPAIVAASAVLLLGRRGLGERIALATLGGAVATFFAVWVALCVACGLTGDCL